MQCQSQEPQHAQLQRWDSLWCGVTHWSIHSPTGMLTKTPNTPKNTHLCTFTGQQVTFTYAVKTKHIYIACRYLMRARQSGILKLYHNFVRPCHDILNISSQKRFINFDKLLTQWDFWLIINSTADLMTELGEDKYFNIQQLRWYIFLYDDNDLFWITC